jgi:hypothetical protein
MTGFPGIRRLTSAKGKNMKTNPTLRLKCASFAFALLVVSGFPALAINYTVTNTADSGPGSLRDAISAAASGDKINFNLSSYPRTITLTSGELLINKNLIIQGPGANQLTINGNHASRVFHTVTDVTLSGLTITNGSAADFGGGVFHENGLLTVTKCVVFGNQTTGGNSRGGGLYVGASLSLRDSTVSQNSAANGSGIYSENSYYGGINNFVSATISRSTIDHNTASVVGGGIYATVTIQMGDSTIAYNSAAVGGGVYTNIISGQDSARLDFCTVTGNSANPNSGGGVFAIANYPYFSLRNSIVAFQQGGGNIVASSSWLDEGGNVATDDLNLNLDPSGLQFNGGPTKTIALLAGSSAIDTAVPPYGASDFGTDGTMLKDQRGGDRPAGSNRDIGAYEYNPSACATVVTNTNDSGPGSLRCAIASAFTDGTITFAPNVGPQISLTSGELLIQKDLTIQGPGAKVLTVSGSSLSRVFFVRGAQVTMSGLTIANGMAPIIGGSSGAGIFVSSLSSYILTPGRLALSACTVTGNQAPDYGGLGAGIGIVGGSLVINNCSISNNHVLPQSDGVGFYGGGIGFRLADITIVNTTISGNTSVYGGGIGLRDTDATHHITITNSTISGNAATLSGGGVYSFAASPVLGSTLIALNSAPSGPDIMTDANPNIGGNPTVSSAGYNLIGTAVGYVWINGAGDQLGVANPGLQLDPNNQPLLKDNGGLTPTIALVPGSPAIDRGFADASLTTDQRGAGFARVIGGAVDVGAFEVQQLPPIARAKNITVPAGPDCQASITPQQVDNGSVPGTAGDTIMLSLDQSGPFAIGTHNVTLTARDSFGYSSTATAVVTVIDNTAPIITAPAATSAIANSQGKAPVPNVLAQTTTFDCSLVTLQQSPAAGTLVSIGVQTITITATDSAHNVSSTTTTFTVKAALPSFTISINPSTVKQGGQVTVTTTYSNPTSTAQTLTLKVSLTTPKTKTLMFTVPLTLKAGQTGSVSMPLPIAKSTPVGLYSVTLDVFVGATQVGTSSAQLTVTK